MLISKQTTLSSVDTPKIHQKLIAFMEYSMLIANMINILEFGKKKKSKHNTNMTYLKKKRKKKRKAEI
jgi:hypothetical protein